MEREITAGRVNVADSVGRNGSGPGIGDSADAPAYEAFISYSHTEYDARVAREVQRFLEGFSIPAPLREGSGRARLGKVFRDEDELAAGSSLARELEAALGSSRWLIVICSPAAAASPWVAREVETFIAQNGRTRVLAVLASGDPETAFPAALQGSFDLGAQTDPCERAGEDGAPSPHAGISDLEPLAADLRRDVARSRRRSELLRLAAPLIGCSFDDLAQRQRARRVRRVAMASLLLLACAAGIGAILLGQQGRVEQTQKAAQSQQLLRRARDSYERGERMAAIEDALAALPGVEGDSALEVEAQATLAQVVGAYHPFINFTPCYELDDIADASTLTVSEDGGWFAVTDSPTRIVAYDLETGAITSEVEQDALMERDGREFTGATFAAGEVLLLPLDPYGMIGYDVERGEALWKQDDLGDLLWVEPFDSSRVVLAEWYEGQLFCTMQSAQTGEVLARIALEGLDADASMLALGARGDMVAVAAGGTMALVDMGAKDVRYAELAASDVADISIDDERIYTVSSEAAMDVVQGGAATICAYDCKSLETLWAIDRSWDGYQLDFSSIPFNTNATICGQGYSTAFDCPVLAVNAGAHALLLDGASGEILADSEAEAPIVSYEYRMNGAGAEVVHATDVTGGRYVAAVTADGFELQATDYYRFPQYVWHVDEVAWAGAQYSIACSAKQSEMILVYCADASIPQEPGAERIDVDAAEPVTFVSDDRARAAVYDGADTIAILDGETFERAATIDLAAAGVRIANADGLGTIMFFSDDDSDRFIVADEGGGATLPRIWQFDATTGELVKTWEWPYEVDGVSYDGCVFSSERSGCLTLSFPNGGYLGIIDVDTLETVQEFTVADTGISDIFVVNDDRYLVIYEGGFAGLYDRESMDLVGSALDEVLLEPEVGSAQIAVAPDGSSFAAASLDGRLMVIDSVTGEALWSHEAAATGMEYIRYTPDGQSILFQDTNGVLFQFAAESGDELARTDEVDALIMMLDFDTDDGLLFVYETDTLTRWLQVFDMDEGNLRLVATIPCGLAVSEAGDAVLSDSGDGLYRQPIYSLDELRTMAEDALNASRGD